MEKVTLFFCDIHGTFDSGHSFNICHSEIKRFVDNLNKLIVYNKTDKLIFVFATTENLDTVAFMEREFKLYINDDISILQHIYCDGVNDVNKPIDIIEYIKRLELTYIIDNNIYYADDSEFFHLVLNDLKDYFFTKYQIKSIIPKNNGLKDVNESIEALLDNPKKKVLVRN